MKTEGGKKVGSGLPTFITVDYCTRNSTCSATSGQSKRIILSMKTEEVKKSERRRGGLGIAPLIISRRGTYFVD